uniref:Uncharacterized protein n=1 Tax=Salix viminalis TaxID=40686 RepID=A0A6N2K953_SALVM
MSTTIILWYFFFWYKPSGPLRAAKLFQASFKVAAYPRLELETLVKLGRPPTSRLTPPLVLWYLFSNFGSSTRSRNTIGQKRLESQYDSV